MREDIDERRQDAIVARRRRHDDDDDDRRMTSQRGQSSPEAEVTASSVGESVAAVLAAHPVNGRLLSAVGSCSGGKMADRAIINNKNRQTSEKHLADAGVQRGATFAT